MTDIETQSKSQPLEVYLCLVPVTKVGQGNQIKKYRTPTSDVRYL